MRIWKTIIALCLALTITACGGGGTGTTSTPTTTTKAYRFLLQGTNQAGGAAAIRFQLVLPAGVTISGSSSNAADITSSLAVTSNVPANTIILGSLTGNTATIIVTPTPPATIADGVFATVTCTVTGTAPAATAFTVPPESVQVFDSALPNPNQITGATVQVQDI